MSKIVSEKLPLWIIENGKPKRFSDHVALARHMKIPTTELVGALASCYLPAIEVHGKVVYMLEPTGTAQVERRGYTWSKIYAYRDEKLVVWPNVAAYAKERGVKPTHVRAAKDAAVDGVYKFLGETLYVNNPEAPVLEKKPQRRAMYYKGGALLIGHQLITGGDSKGLFFLGEVAR